MEKRKQKVGKSLVMLICMLLLITVCSCASSDSKYEEAMEFLDEGNYYEAYIKFVNIVDYEDAKERLQEIIDNHSKEAAEGAIKKYIEETYKGLEYEIVSKEYSLDFEGRVTVNCDLQFETFTMFMDGVVKNNKGKVKFEGQFKTSVERTSSIEAAKIIENELEIEGFEYTIDIESLVPDNDCQIDTFEYEFRKQAGDYEDVYSGLFKLNFNLTDGCWNLKVASHEKTRRLIYQTMSFEGNTNTFTMKIRSKYRVGEYEWEGAKEYLVSDDYYRSMMQVYTKFDDFDALVESFGAEEKYKVISGIQFYHTPNVENVVEGHPDNMSIYFRFYLDYISESEIESILGSLKIG